MAGFRIAITQRIQHGIEDIKMNLRLNKILLLTLTQERALLEKRIADLQRVDVDTLNAQLAEVITNIDSLSAEGKISVEPAITVTLTDHAIK